MKALETPAAQLTAEALVLSLAPIIRNDFGNEEIFVEDLPCPAVGHPADDVSMFRVGQNAVQLSREIIGLFAVAEGGKFGVGWTD